MPRLRLLTVVFLGAAAFSPFRPAAGAQAPASPAPRADLPTFTAGTNAVTLDVIVRDKKGRMVRDLSASDFEVFEDGVRQAVHSFEVYGRRTEDARGRARGRASQRRRSRGGGARAGNAAPGDRLRLRSPFPGRARPRAQGRP